MVSCDATLSQSEHGGGGSGGTWRTTQLGWFYPPAVALTTRRQTDVLVWCFVTLTDSQSEVVSSRLLLETGFIQ